MPTYEYRCECGQVAERICKIADRPIVVACRCGGLAKRMVSQTAIQSDEPGWLDDSVRGALQDDGEKPIETRGEYNKLLKDKGIVCSG